MKIKLKSLLTIVTIVSFLSLSSFSYTKVYAASLTSLSDTLTRIQTSQASNHTISFTTPTGIAGAATLSVTFPAGFNLSTIVFGDIDLADDGTDVTLAATPTGTTWGAAVAGQVLTFTNGSSAVVAGSVITIEIGTHATYGVTGTHQITNPSSANTYVITIAGSFGDTGSIAVDIITSDQVTISASVDATMDVNITSTTCALGTLSTSSVETCQYNVSVSTNAANGYKSTILDDGNLRNGSNDINDAGGDNDVDQGSEEYGVATSKAGQTVVQYTTCNDPGANPQPASAITTSAQQFASATGPVNADSTTLCHAASISGLTPAGSYSHIATIIVTATF